MIKSRGYTSLSTGKTWDAVFLSSDHNTCPVNCDWLCFISFHWAIFGTMELWTFISTLFLPSGGSSHSTLDTNYYQERHFVIHQSMQIRSLLFTSRPKPTQQPLIYRPTVGMLGHFNMLPWIRYNIFVHTLLPLLVTWYFASTMLLTSNEWRVNTLRCQWQCIVSNPVVNKPEIN